MGSLSVAEESWGHVGGGLLPLFNSETLEMLASLSLGFLQLENSIIIHSSFMQVPDKR